MTRDEAKRHARLLRSKGAKFRDISNTLQIQVSKSTLSYWLKDTPLPSNFLSARTIERKQQLERAREVARKMSADKRRLFVNRIFQENKHLHGLLRDVHVARIALGVLYLCEGGKNRKGALVFGNSDPNIIRLFLRLLRQCFSVDESRFRCTVQGRADQDYLELQKYWSKVTDIPATQFYKPQIDKRTIGKPTKRVDYKGVCRVDYFSSEVFTTLAQVMKILTMGR